MIRMSVMVIAGLALATPAVAEAQGARGEAQARAEARGEARGQGQQQGQQDAEARIQAAFQTALEAGIPVALLERKQAEGRAKGVSPERIAAAVEARLQGLTRAQAAFQRGRIENVTEGDLALGADALQAGVSERALIEVNRQAPQERRAVATALLADLVVLGQVPDQALARVNAALRQGPDGLASLNAETAATLRARGLVGVGAGAGVGGAVRTRPQP
jgi:hypothetical protein